MASGLRRGIAACTTDLDVLTQEEPRPLLGPIFEVSDRLDSAWRPRCRSSLLGCGLGEKIRVRRHRGRGGRVKLDAAKTDRAAGVLLGTAVRDALGVPYEFGRAPGPDEQPEMRGAGSATSTR